METYKQFYQQWKEKVDIYILYILEAHFVEKDENGNFIGGWPIGYQYNYEQHKSMEDRIKMAKILETEFQLEIPIILDEFSNGFNNIYRPWSDRAFLFIDNKIEYMGQINEDGTRNTIWTNEIHDLLLKKGF